MAGVSDVTSSITHSVEAVVSSVSSGLMEAVASSVSAGVGDTVHNVSAGLKRLLTSPPSEEDIKEEEEKASSDSILPTPVDSGFNEVFTDGSLLSALNYCIPIPNSESPPSSHQFDLDHDFRNLGIAENYFSEPEIFDLGSDASIEDLENAILKSKDLILNCGESTKKRRILVQRLIQLRLALERAKEEKEVSADGMQVRQGHQLTPYLSRIKSSSTSKQFCDKCSQVIWSVIHVTYRCCLCDYQCHGKCVKSKHRKCPSLVYAENPTYICKICPEVGLAAQDYRCAQCRNLITSMHPRSLSCLEHTFCKANVWGEPRLCDYSGQYFCPACHWNSRMTSPARVIHNWDFEEYPVSQQSKHFLTYVITKPLLSLEELNPHLFKFVQELYVVKKLRKELIMMKNYLRTCRSAQESRLLRRLEVKQHFVDNAYTYSLQDLIDLNQGILLPFLNGVHEEFLSHIKEKCEVCRGKAFICEVCKSNKEIFPFDDRVTICKICQASFHEECFDIVSVCPKCIRQSSRRLKCQQEAEENSVR